MVPPCVGNTVLYKHYCILIIVHLYSLNSGTVAGIVIGVTLMIIVVSVIVILMVISILYKRRVSILYSIIRLSPLIHQPSYNITRIYIFICCIFFI